MMMYLLPLLQGEKEKQILLSSLHKINMFTDLKNPKAKAKE